MSRYRRSLADGSTFFFTVNLADRNGTLLVDEIALLRTAYRVAKLRQPFEDIAICVLPNHLHAIWQLPTEDADFGQRWSNIKRHFSKHLPVAETRSDSKIAKRERGIWQRRFWEHQIRNDLDLERHVDYIHNNPVKHGYVLRASDWPHSSFHRYVRDGVLAADWGINNYADGQITGEFGE